MNPRRVVAVFAGAGTVLALAASCAWLALGLSGTSGPLAVTGSGVRTLAVSLGVAGLLGLTMLLTAWWLQHRQARDRQARAAEAQRRLLLDASDVLQAPLAWYRVDTQRAWINRAMADLLARQASGDSDPPCDWPSLLDPQDALAWSEALAETLRTGRACHLNIRFASGMRPGPWLVQATPFVDAGDAGHSVLLEVRGAGEALAQAETDRMRALLELAESEKWQFGQAVHDELGQRLSGIAYFAKALQRRLQAQGRTEADDAGWLTELANETMGVARSLARGLNPVGSDDPEALTTSLADLCRNTSRMFDVDCQLEGDEGFDAGGMSSANHLYHAVQELVTNAVRHGVAKRITVQLQVGSRGQRLAVRNDGLALPAAPAAGRRGMGLAGVRSRVAHLDGHFSLANDPAGGVVATIELPAAQDEAAVGPPSAGGDNAGVPETRP